MKNKRPKHPRGIFAGMDEDAFQKLKKIVTDDKEEQKNNKPKKKGKWKVNYKKK